jgi:hypothetical protein
VLLLLLVLPQALLLLARLLHSWQTLECLLRLLQ